MLLAATDVGVPLEVPGISLHVELERLVGQGLASLRLVPCGPPPSTLLASSQ